MQIQIHLLNFLSANSYLPAVSFKRQDDRIIRVDKGGFLDGNNNVLEENVRAERFTVRDDGFAEHLLRSVPAI